MSNIRNWSTTVADNDDADLANGADWREGMQAKLVNNSARANMAGVKGFANELPWYDLGLTPTRTGNTTFTVPVDATAYFLVERRLKLADLTTLYGSVVSASFGGGVTTVTVALDSGSLSTSLTTVHYAVEDPTNVSAPASFGRTAYATTGGSGSAYTASYVPKIPAWRDGVSGRIKLHTNAAATPTFAPDGLTAKTMVLPGNVAIASGDLTTDSVLAWVYDVTLDRVVIVGAPSVVSNIVLASIHANIRAL